MNVRPIVLVKATRRRAAFAELFYQKGHSYAPFYDNVKSKVHPSLDESLIKTFHKAHSQHRAILVSTWITFDIDNLITYLNRHEKIEQD